MHELPNDINSLRALVLEQNVLLLQQQQAITSLQHDLSDKSTEIEQLKSQLAELRRRHFGQSSEKVKRQIVRLEKQLSELEEEHIQALASRDPGVPAALRQSPVRKPFPAELPREIQRLEPQEEACPECGGELSRSLLGYWVGAVSDLLRPLVDEIQRTVLQPGKVHGDDTPVQVQEPGRGKTRTGRLWAYVRDDRNAGSTVAPAVWFSYSPDRKGVHPQTHLKDYQGVLQADAYTGFDEL